MGGFGGDSAAMAPSILLGSPCSSPLKNLLYNPPLRSLDPKPYTLNPKPQTIPYITPLLKKSDHSLHQHDHLDFCHCYSYSCTASLGSHGGYSNSCMTLLYHNAIFPRYEVPRVMQDFTYPPVDTENPA